MYKDIQIKKDELEMYQDLRDKYGVFARHLDTFIAAAFIGCLMNKEKHETSNNVEELRNRIPQSVILTSINDFENVLNVIAFIHHSRLKSSKILEKVFVDTNDALLHKQGIAINYARGGIEMLYDLIASDAKGKFDAMTNVYNIFNQLDNIVPFSGETDDISDVLEKFLN